MNVRPMGLCARDIGHYRRVRPGLYSMTATTAVLLSGIKRKAAATLS
jgi:hypothetical protein